MLTGIAFRASKLVRNPNGRQNSSCELRFHNVLGTSHIVVNIDGATLCPDLSLEHRHSLFLAARIVGTDFPSCQGFSKSFLQNGPPLKGTTSLKFVSLLQR